MTEQVNTEAKKQKKWKWIIAVITAVLSALGTYLQQNSSDEHIKFQTELQKAKNRNIELQIKYDSLKLKDSKK